MCCRLFGKHLKSLNGYLWERPPILVFLLFIAGLGIGCLILASYIQRNQYVIDFEASKEYKSLVGKLEKIQFCATKHTKQYNATERLDILNQHGKTNFVNISIPIKISLSVIGNSSMVKFPAQEITSIIPYYLLLETDDHVHNIGVYVFLHESLLSKQSISDQPGKTFDGCAVMTVKRDAIPLQLPQNICDVRRNLKNSNLSTIHMTSNAPPSKTLLNKKAPIIDGVFMSLKSKHQFQPTVYLNIMDRGIISGRLNTTSYVFFVILVACILYAIMRGATIVEYKKVTEN